MSPQDAGVGNHRGVAVLVEVPAALLAAALGPVLSGVGRYLTTHGGSAKVRQAARYAVLALPPVIAVTSIGIAFWIGVVDVNRSGTSAQRDVAASGLLTRDPSADAQISFLMARATERATFATAQATSGLVIATVGLIVATVAGAVGLLGTERPAERAAGNDGLPVA